MAKYIPYKTKKFKLKKDAVKWTKDTKGAYKGAMQMKIETNYNANDPFPWEGIVLMKDI